MSAINAMTGLEVHISVHSAVILIMGYKKYTSLDFGLNDHDIRELIYEHLQPLIKPHDEIRPR